MERILESRKAYDLNRYKENGCFNIRGLERDTAALVIEASGKIHSFFLALLPDGTVVNPTISKTRDVSSFYADDSPQTKKEKEAGLKIRNALINEQVDTICAWISPPEGEFDYKEGRLEIGRIRKILGIKIIQSYGIPLKKVTPEYCESLFLKLEEFSTKPSQNINSPEDLRNKISIFNTPDGNSWIDFLIIVFPELKDNLNKIKNGKVHRLKMKAIEDARIEVKKEFQSDVIPKGNLTNIGARIERGMIKRGWSLEGRICGFLNMDFEILNSGFFGMAKIKNERNERKAKFVKNCPFCGKEYNCVLKPGFVCKGKTSEGEDCKKVFEGAC